MPRRFAIADIHGCYLTFRELLDEIELTDDDELYLLGDFVDRGPRTCQLLDYIIDLQQQGRPVHCLRGNHDQYMVDALLDGSKRTRKLWRDSGADTTYDSYPRRRIDPRHIAWLDRLPHYILLDDYVLVHAGLNFRRRNPLKGRKAMLSRRNWYRHIDYGWLDGRCVVHGHTPLPRIQVVSQADPNRRAYPVFDIDAGCFHRRPGMGHLCALDLDKREFTFVPNRDRE